MFLKFINIVFIFCAISLSHTSLAVSRGSIVVKSLILNNISSTEKSQLMPAIEASLLLKSRITNVDMLASFLNSGRGWHISLNCDTAIDLKYIRFGITKVSDNSFSINSLINPSSMVRMYLSNSDLGVNSLIDFDINIFFFIEPYYKYSSDITIFRASSKTGISRLGEDVIKLTIYDIGFFVESQVFDRLFTKMTISLSKQISFRSIHTSRLHDISRSFTMAEEREKEHIDRYDFDFIQRVTATKSAKSSIEFFSKQEFVYSYKHVESYIEDLYVAFSFGTSILNAIYKGLFSIMDFRFVFKHNFNVKTNAYFLMFNIELGYKF